MLTFRDITAADREIVIPMVVDFYHTDAVDHEVPVEIMERAFAAAADPAESLLRGVLVCDGEEVVVTKSIYPVYRGALVVCDGGDEARVKLAVTEAVTALTGLSADRVTVAKWQ